MDVGIVCFAAYEPQQHKRAEHEDREENTDA